MTDKVRKIREEVERLYNQSLADENRQTERGLERAANVSYGKSKVCKELLSFIDSLQEEPASEDLEKIAELYTLDDSMKPWRNLTKEAFIGGANWQKNKMMEDAMDGIIAESAGGDGWVNVMTGFVKSKDVNVKFGDKIKIIIIKEE